MFFEIVAVPQNSKPVVVAAAAQRTSLQIWAGSTPPLQKAIASFCWLQKASGRFPGDSGGTEYAAGGQGCSFQTEPAKH